MIYEGYVNAMQHFSTGDGPGIRTTVFLQGCNLRCRWCHNPETWAFEKAKTMTVEQVLAYVLEDKEFYQASGGGVTISGGEPLCQPEFAAALASACKENGLHVLIDTAGQVPYSAFETVMPYTDRFYFDIKAATEEDYRLYTGGSFLIVYENLKRLMGEQKEVTVRIPIIPGHNDREEYIEKTAKMLKAIGVKQADLLPFHRLGTAKYKKLGIAYPYASCEPPSEATMQTLRAILKEALKEELS